ncbi:MAG TPA: hypothetical protein VH597_15095 [Verrucomicrobiae bacterium]|jgi:hypothetical protein|nr:hypothetical protein [Verrucomicrobiae bacterium]
MASHNQYHGYVKLPKKESYRTPLRLDFNQLVRIQKGSSKLDGFALRLFVPAGELGDGSGIELGVTLRPEEWLDLIEAMKEVFETAQQVRKESEGD